MMRIERKSMVISWSVESFYAQRLGRITDTFRPVSRRYF
jgi:hypothetical protein